MRKEKLFTQRLLLRKLRKEDSEAMFRNWDNDPEVAKYTFWVAHKNKEETQNLVDMWLKQEQENSLIERFIIILKDNEELIGAIDTVKFKDGIPEIGYALSRKYWNKGYMTEACRAFIEYLFELGYQKLIIRADERNIGSIRVIEKCGFIFTHKENIECRSEARPESVVVNWYELTK